jgi:hypothetical protein
MLFPPTSKLPLDPAFEDGREQTQTAHHPSASQARRSGSEGHDASLSRQFCCVHASRSRRAPRSRADGRRLVAKRRGTFLPSLPTSAGSPNTTVNSGPVLRGKLARRTSQRQPFALILHPSCLTGLARYVPCARRSQRSLRLRSRSCPYACHVCPSMPAATFRLQARYASRRRSML